MGLLQKQMMPKEAKEPPSFALPADHHSGGSNSRFGISF
jgi:hypothetical protein